MDRWDDLETYAYELPERLIATQPLARRDASRLLVLDRRSGLFHHRDIADLPELLQPGDCLVLNDTRVVPARLIGRRAATGGKWEGLFLGTAGPGEWRIMGQTRGRLLEGEAIVLTAAHRSGSELILRLLERDEEGVWTVCPEEEGDPLDLLGRFGTVPLPPYIRRQLPTSDDWERYQTTYARRPGAIAAPTAGLHFTPELLGRCRERGIDTAYVTLHVGIGTFRPIAVPRLSEHRMHTEWGELSDEAAAQLAAVRARGGRIIAVGTTSVRTLESAAASGELRAWHGETNLFIRPPYEFRAIDGLLTNFHLPRSTLLVLVSAFAGIEQTRAAYEAAIAEEYRFYSYGDAMLIL